MGRISLVVNLAEISITVGVSAFFISHIVRKDSSLCLVKPNHAVYDITPSNDILPAFYPLSGVPISRAPCQE